MRLMLIAAMLPLVACQSAEAPASQSGGGSPSRSFSVSGFTGVDLIGSDAIDGRPGAQFSVVADGDPAVLDLLDISVGEDTLRVSRKPQDGRQPRGSARIHVVMPVLHRAASRGSGSIKAMKAQGDFSGSVAGSGTVSVAALRGGTVQLSVNGSGSVDVAGTADTLNAAVAGSGSIKAARLTAAGADVSIAGSGSLLATVKGRATVSLAGSGTAQIGGGATCTIQSRGSGKVRCS